LRNALQKGKIIVLNYVYLNQQYIELKDAKISVLDRGFLFGDGVYEVIPVYNNTLFRVDEHLNRLEQSLQALRIRNPLTQQQWLEIFATLIQKNQVSNASIYLQVTRGTGQVRAHLPTETLTPTIFVACSALKKKKIAELKAGLTAITLPDLRWQHCYIKTISLLANVLALERAYEADAQAALFIRDGLVTEECMRNVFIVKNNVIKTPVKNQSILGGITRDVIIELAHQHHLPLEETAITEHDLLTADEVFVSSSTLEIVPILKINDALINNGQAGPVWEKLITLYRAFIENYE